MTGHYRAAEATTVRFAERLIDVIAVPYSTPATVDDQQGHYTEQIAPGAFAGITHQGVRALRDHAVNRVIGNAVEIDTADPQALKATLKISRTLLGDESLELAHDGALGVSVYFTSAPAGERWNRARTQVTRMRAGLREISLVPFPAYATAAVVGVRDDTPRPVTITAGTPRLDELRRRARLEELHRLYGPTP